MDRSPDHVPSAAQALTPTTATGPGGSIYDLGYQRYLGPRLGRRHARTALFRSTLRAAYGVGRGGRAKIAPITLTGLAMLPAVLAVGIAALAAQAGVNDGSLNAVSPVRYETYHGLTITLLMLFCAAQSPELFGRDQRHGVLPLYFSRALTRADYAVARVAGLMLALLFIDLAPELILFVGRSLVASDPLAGFGHEAASVPRFVAQGLLTAGLLGGISGLVATLTPRRAYATAAIIALMIVPPVVVALVGALDGGDIGRILVLLSPGDVLDGANAWFFGVISENPTVSAIALPGWIYVVAALIATVASVLLTLRRYRGIAA
jgi:ABC-2 type transport system permease protein